MCRAPNVKPTAGKSASAAARAVSPPRRRSVRFGRPPADPDALARAPVAQHVQAAEAGRLAERRENPLARDADALLSVGRRPVEVTQPRIHAGPPPVIEREVGARWIL